MPSSTTSSHNQHYGAGAADTTTPSTCAPAITRADGKPRRWIQRTIMGWCAQEVDVSKLDAKCLMQRKWVPIKDDVTYFDNKNEAEGIYI